MGFPYQFEANFEAGGVAEWDSETDTESRLSVVHYTELARRVPKATPFRGAYCAMIELSGSGTADAFLVEGDVDMADTETWHARLAIFFADNFAATADEAAFSILEFQGAADAITASFGAKVTAATGAIQLGIGSAASAAVPATFAAQSIQRGKWYQVDLALTVQTGGTGTMTMKITAEDEPFRASAAVSLTGKTNIAVTRAVLGVQDHLATTTGIFLLDAFATDDTELPLLERFPEHVLLTKSGHVFVGNGAICDLTLLTGSAADNVAKVYDTDRAVLSRQVAEVDSVAATETVPLTGVFAVSNGCYVTLEGTAPRATLRVNRAAAYSSPGIRRHGLVA